MFFDKPLQRPIGRQGFHNIKAAVMRNQQIILEIIQKVCDTGEAFTFHDDSRPELGMIGESSATGQGGIFGKHG